MSLEYTEIEDTYLYSRPKSQIKPPVEKKLQKLPFNELRWDDFEKLILAISLKNENIKDPRIYGIKGQKQEGIDIIADWGKTTKKWVCQVKRWKLIRPSNLRNFVKKFINGKWKTSTFQFILATNYDFTITKLQNEYQSQKKK